MAKSFQIEIKLKAQEDEENNLSNNYKLLQSSYEEFRVKGRQDWGSEKELS